MCIPRQESFLMGSVVVDTDDVFVAKTVSAHVRTIPLAERPDSGSLVVGERTVHWRVIGKKPDQAGPV